VGNPIAPNYWVWAKKAFMGDQAMLLAVVPLACCFGCPVCGTFVQYQLLLAGAPVAPRRALSSVHLDLFQVQEGHPWHTQAHVARLAGVKLGSQIAKGDSRWRPVPV